MQRLNSEAHKRNKEAEDFANREFLKGPDLSTQTTYGRPALPRLDDRKDAIEFMQIDCDYYTERPKRAANIGKCDYSRLFPPNKINLT